MLFGARTVARKVADGVQVVADGVADDDVWAPFECPDEIVTAEVDQVKAKS
jgi:hypothetical protein